MQLGVFFIDVKNTEKPGEGLRNDGGNGNAGHPPMKHYHKQKVET